ncbi:MAG TPA: sigma factor, partial [Bryobacteraceae bacterium]|nr:sigma factor [Bryobacteraceae bacterium]
MKDAVGSGEAAHAAEERPPYFIDLYLKSNGREIGLSFADFAEMLREIAARYLPPGSSDAETAELHRGLRLEELALARACAAGQEAAWERFIVRYRPKLYQIAAAITHDETSARELADSLYADLYGSKLRSYTGRGSLEGWLRTVAAQEFVDRYRKGRRLVSFD